MPSLFPLSSISAAFCARVLHARTVLHARAPIADRDDRESMVDSKIN